MHGEKTSPAKLIYQIDIKKEIDHTTQIYLSKGLAEANKVKADGVVIHLNTYGGLVDVADSMRTSILYSPIPVYVFIDNNAASAGALLSIACKKIFMRKGANIGAATVVDQSGAAMPDKYQSYMRSMIRSTAEAQGKDTLVQGGDTVYRWKRDPKIAEAMVDDRIVIPGLIDSGKVLTFTAGEALEWRYCDGIAESVDEVITKYLGYDNYEIERFTPSWLDNMRGFLMNPFLQSFLILFIIGGIYFEMQSPGLGFPSIVAILGAVLYFLPLYIEGLAANWEILLFIIGLILIAIEIFVVPGFGVPGIAGGILVVGGLILSLLGNVNFDFEGVSGDEIGRAILTVLLGVGLGFFSLIWLSSRIGRRGPLQRMALVTDLEGATTSLGLNALIGKQGKAETVLRPSGTVNIDGELYDGVSESGFIEKGKTIVVVRTGQAQVYVEEIRF
ncbi:NfeD family protein [Parabacteroides sp. Marseille-P3160]|uniref:NfeD family protein n=1 Tax=Parabacteroides sp. Marseille-P3160 TaxID=1917887 RepID=UPI0009BBA055